ncbi:MAG TPA: septum site-determining protein MinC [Ktedonobacterales bacterium]
MKPAPPPPVKLEPQPPLERLRERARGAMSRLGQWARRLFAPGQESRAVDKRSMTGVGESARGRGREEPSAAGASRPISQVTSARLSQPARSQRPYQTETLSDARLRRAEGGNVGMPKEPSDRLDPSAAQPAGQAEERVAEPTPRRSAEVEASAGPAPEQTEEARRALARKLLRGSRSGLLLTLEPGYVWAQVLEVLAAALAESPTFFQGALLSVDTRRRPLESSEVEALQALLVPYEMTFKEVGSDELHDPRTLPSGATRPPPAGDTTPTLAIRASDVTNTLFTRRTIRSGQRLRYESSVVILGDVNAGAEVIAGGDVVVWGTLRGTVHAGYPANEEAIVCALALAPVQLRIGALASRPPEDGGLPPQMPEVASVKNGQIVVESWNAGRASRR